MATPGLPLPEIGENGEEEFERSWTKFKLVAAANKWDDAKALLMLPALLRGKLVEIYVSLRDEEKADLDTLKRALKETAGLTRDQLSLSKAFSERKQGMQEKVTDFERGLKKLFQEAYPNEKTTSSTVLLQHFLTGLRPEITKQILLQGAPKDIADAVKAAISVERALTFANGPAVYEQSPAPVHAVEVVKAQDDHGVQKLMEQVLHRLEALESRFTRQEEPQPQLTAQDRRPYRRCYKCGKEGHLRRNCPTNRHSERDTGGPPYAEHLPDKLYKVCGVNYATLQVHGMLGNDPIDFLVDSGAAVSVVTNDILPTSVRTRIIREAPHTVGANGSALDVLGRLEIPITLGQFCASHEFVVVRHLTVQCLLANFSPNIAVHPISKKDEDIVSATMPNIDLNSSELNNSQRRELEALISEFRDIFVSPGQSLGRTSAIKHSIRVEGPPVRQPLRRIPYALQDTVRTEVQKMLKEGIIRESSSPWSSPVLMVKKKDGTWRFCVDYRKLNAITHKDAYPLPRIDETLESLSGSQFFTTLDLASGYWQVEVEEGDKEKTAFSTRDGHYEFNVMPFGLTNAPATFERLMECVLAGLTYSGSLNPPEYEQCLVYLDDIVIFSMTFPQHLERLATVFQHLRKAGLTLKPEKCHFAQKEIHYLGHIVSCKGVQADPEKIKAITSYPVPSDIKELRQFLGLSNYYRRFIEHYSDITEPLHKLTRKSGSSYQWTEQCDSAFRVLKQRLTTPPILAYPNFSNPFVLATDASGIALGGILSQTTDGKEQVIAYWSRQMNNAERRYSTIEREALAVVAAVKEFYPYLYGRPFTLLTDHNPLTSLQGLKDTGGRLTRWLLYLQQFDIKVLYRPGRCNGNADTMSRRPDDSADQVAVVNEITCLSDTEMLRQEQAKDAYIAEIMQKLQTDGSDHKHGEYQLKKGLLMRQRGGSDDSHAQLVVPAALRQMVLEELHNKSGHLGTHKTLEKVKERFFWQGYEQDVRNMVQQCERCQKRTNPVPTQHAPIGTIESNHPFQKLSWDIMGPLPAAASGCRYILVVTDLFSKWVEAFPLKSTDSLTLARVLVDEIVCRYGVPHYLHSDQGANFVSTVIQSLCSKLGIKRTQTTPYHPQGNGQVERFNRTLEAMLSKVVADNQKDWDEHLQTVLFAYRTAVHDSTGFTPFSVMFGRSPTLPVDVMLGRTQQEQCTQLPQYVRKLQQSVKAAFAEVRQKLVSAHQHQKQFADAHIIDRISVVNYRVQLIGSTKCLIVHSNRLKPYYGCPEKVEIDVTEKEPAKSPEKNCMQDRAGYTWVEYEDDVNHGGENEGHVVENEPVNQGQEDAAQGPVEQLLEADVPMPPDLGHDTAPEVTVEVQSIWDTTAAPGLLDDWNCAHPVKIPFGWEGQLHECQQQFCVDLSLLVDHLTFVVGCFDNCCVHCPIKRAK
ncbi:hypothetical protein EMCRGX_G010306 [Ephydatia muelleri]